MIAGPVCRNEAATDDTNTTLLTTMTTTPDPAMAACGPTHPINGPPTRLPIVLAPETTVACAVRAPRRSSPDVARVTMAVVAAFPAGTVRPIRTDTAPITIVAGCNPITTQPRPAISQVVLLSTAGRVERAASTPPAEPTTAPTEYAVRPIVASSAPRPVS